MIYLSETGIKNFKISKAQYLQVNFMMLYLVFCCIFTDAYTANPQNLSRFYEHFKEQNIIQSNCSYFNGEFLCKDKHRCIDLEDTCNGVCNCLDCSDETDQCWIYDEDVCRACNYLCLPTPDGLQCICGADNFKFSPVCKEISECSEDNLCDQHCVKYKALERCSCGENYRGMPTTRGHTCISDVSYENRIIYSTYDKIKLYNFTADKYSVVRDKISCNGLAAAHDDFYYGVPGRSTGYIYKSSMVTGRAERVAEIYSPTIFSIDVDWITGNIYFSTVESLGVCSKSGLFRALVKPLKSHIDLCYISVAPRSGYSAYTQLLLFHSVVTKFTPLDQKSQIMKSGMDGSDETVLVSGELRCVIALTVDDFSKKLYWVDSELRKVESIQYNGNNRKVWFSHGGFDIFSISKFENNIFWSEGTKNTIGLDFQMNSKVIKDINVSNVKFLYAYNPLLQQTKIPNPCKNAACNGICLLRPSQSEGLNFTCLCADNSPSNDSHWCNNVTTHVDWQFEDDDDADKIVVRLPPSPPPSTTKWGIVISLFILATVATCLIYRRKDVYKFYERIHYRNQGREEFLDLNEL